MSIAPEDNSFYPEPIYGRQNTYCAPRELAATRVRKSAPSSYWDRLDEQNRRQPSRTTNK